MRIDKIIIGMGRMRVFLGFDEHEARYTDGHIAAEALKIHPSLKVHSCINSKGPTFGAVIERTSIAHLIEHLMIAEQSEIASKKGITDITFVGTTQWIDEDKGIAEVQVSFIDDLDAISALKKSAEEIASICRN